MLESTTFTKELFGKMVRIFVYECYEIIDENGKCPLMAQCEIWDNKYYPLIIPIKLH